ncbi:DUF5689 domain-containing protein [Segatella oris]|uniref:DUF5689 domain-containing protein n=1 Tax=Segatella oris TaxID=28135 RepID=A0A3S4TD36_9BACT|nr:DUF5689 domain-containing protein [Segatella oris]VEH14311.1 Uncharacterised protein [Segatella oris]
MKNIKYIMLALLCGLFTGCMDGDWDTPSGGHTRGNAQIKETNVQTIAQLKAKYASTLASAYGYTQVTDDEQIKAVVTGNDIEGNLFGQISVDDGTGAMLIAISEGGINGYLPVGTEILISLKDLYIGNYGYQPQIGTLYESAKGQTSVSRMARMRWDQHFTYTDNNKTVTPVEFDKSKISDANYLAANCGKLMTLKNVYFKDGGQKVYANKADVVNNNSCERALKGINANNLVVRTSTYADFAADTLPVSKVNITGVFTRYNNKWQVIIRSAKDVEYVQ